MMPLCTTAKLPEVCGCALASDGSPWVAQRVCAIPVPPINGFTATASSRAFTLPKQRTRCNSWFGSTTATPAES